MMKAVFKTLAISFGGGLALGAGLRLAQGPVKPRETSYVDLDPLLSRLSKLEHHITEREARPHVAPAAPVPSPVFERTLAAFESKLAAQVREVEVVRSEIRRVDQRLGELDSHLPVIVQSTVDVRFREVERRLQRQFEEVQNRSMAAFVDTLQSKVVERITTLETNLSEQSNVIGKLRDASLRTDENLQKMLVGIERLVDQTRTPPPAAASTPPVSVEDSAPEIATPPAAAAAETPSQDAAEHRSRPLLVP